MDKDAEIKLLRQAIRLLENDYILQGSVLEAIEQILDGQEPSDFMLSFPLVRKAWDVVCARKDCKQQPGIGILGDLESLPGS